MTQEGKHDLLNQAVAYRKTDQLDNAKELLQRILERYPEDIFALNEMGIILTRTGELDRAISHFDKILRIKPSDSYALNQLGMIYNRQGEWAKALDVFKRVLATEPANIHALSELGSTYNRIGDTERALKYFKEISLISRGALTEQLKDSKREIREKDAQLIAAGRITTATAMATSLAHQINNPLQVIQTVIYRLERKVPAEERETRADLTKIKVQADRINLLISHLNKLIKDEPEEYTYSNLSDIIRGAVSLFEEQLHSRGITVDLTGMDIPGQTLVAYGSAIKLEQVFINLLANSRDALSHVPNAEIRVSANHSDRTHIVVDFHDNGRGIPRRHLDRVFKALFTTKSGGTGLGLWLCASVIQQMRGTIQVRSDRRKGTMFTIRLPNHGGR